MLHILNIMKQKNHKFYVQVLKKSRCRKIFYIANTAGITYPVVPKCPYFTTYNFLWVVKANKNMVKVSLMETKMDYTNSPLISFTLYATCLKHYERNKKNRAAKNCLYVPYLQQNNYRLNRFNTAYDLCI
jgi:hypothetical protein